MTIEQRVCSAIEQYWYLSSVTPLDNKDSLNFDSLDDIECLCLMEDTFGIEIDEYNLEGNLNTVGDLVKLVESILEGKVRA